MKTGKRLSLIVPVVCLCGIGGGCDEQVGAMDDSDLKISAKTQSLTPNTSNVDTENTKPSDSVNTTNKEAPTMLIKAFWENFDRDKGETVDSLNLVLENVLNEEIVVTANLLCSGMIKFSSTLEIGSVRLLPGENTQIEVPVEKIPIQTSSGVNQATPELVLSIPTEEGTVERRIIMPGFHYQFSRDYKTIRIFNQKTLLTEYNGRLAGFEKDKIGTGQILGKVLDNKGGARNITVDDDAFVERKNGQVVGYETGIRIGIITEEEVKQLMKEAQ